MIWKYEQKKIVIFITLGATFHTQRVFVRYVYRFHLDFQCEILKATNFRCVRCYADFGM